MQSKLTKLLANVEAEMEHCSTRMKAMIHEPAPKLTMAEAGDLIGRMRTIIQDMDLCIAKARALREILPVIIDK